MTTGRQTLHVEHVLIEVTSLLVSRARIQLEREAGTDPTAADDLRRLHDLEKQLEAIRHDVGLAEAGATPSGRQVSRFYEVPGQEDA